MTLISGCALYHALSPALTFSILNLPYNYILIMMKKNDITSHANGC